MSKKNMSANKLIIANCSGFYGDRLSAAKEMVMGGPIDVLTGDYLAELTMAILQQKKKKDTELGYVSTFLTQMEEVMGQCLKKNIRVVCNAGGLNPASMAKALKKVADKLGLIVNIAYIDGDDLMLRLKDLQDQGEKFQHLDNGILLADSDAVPISANAYMGGWGIVKALEEGANIVVCGRVADAAVVAAPAAWHFNWSKDDWDCIAGAYAAGHIIECGIQATGGNYSFIDEVPSYKNMGFPIAEIFEDGSFTITKHPDTGGLVSVGTVTAQLLYEINAPSYLTPDVIVRFDTLTLTQECQDRVKASGIKGEPPTKTSKVCINTLGGHKNSMTIILTGLDIKKKADMVTEQLFESLGGRDQFKVTDVQLIRSDKSDPMTNDEACAYLRISVIDPDAEKAGRFFSSKIIEMALASIPGFNITGPPSYGAPAIIHWPCLVSAKYIIQQVNMDTEIFFEDALIEFDTPVSVKVPKVSIPDPPGGKRVKAPIGRVFATRSGDKGGNANLGIWGRTPAAYAFLNKFLTVQKLTELLPDITNFEIDRYEMPNLLAINFYIHGILGDGVAASVRSDPQAKTLGEYLRKKIIEMPMEIMI